MWVWTNETQPSSFPEIGVWIKPLSGSCWFWFTPCEYERPYRDIYSFQFFNVWGAEESFFNWTFEFFQKLQIFLGFGSYPRFLIWNWIAFRCGFRCILRMFLLSVVFLLCSSVSSVPSDDSQNLLAINKSNKTHRGTNKPRQYYQYFVIQIYNWWKRQNPWHAHRPLGFFPNVNKYRGKRLRIKMPNECYKKFRDSRL